MPIDIFRIVQGIIAFAYFLHLFYQADDFSSPYGFIDHELVQEIFWYTRISLFHPGLPLVFFKAVFILACMGSLALAAGYRPRVLAFFLFLITVSTYRRNFLLPYWDDAVMHLMLFWLILLPAGHTLNLREYLQDRHSSWHRWKQTKVPGPALRCFLWNLALIYFVSGIWKLTSNMWMEGTALYVALKTPASYAANFWSPNYLPYFKVGNYLTIIIELLFPLILVLPKNHFVKWLFLLALLGFHFGIIATLKVPYSNISLVAALAIVFRHELMEHVFNTRNTERSFSVSRNIDRSGKLALVFVIVLTLSMTRFVPGFVSKEPSTYGLEESGIDARSVGGLTTLHKSLYSILWVAGIAQQYQLFDWIDQRNYSFRYEITEVSGLGASQPIDSRKLFPNSTRGLLLQGYLHDIIWVNIPVDQRYRLKISLIQRFTNRFCHEQESEGNISVYSNIRRIDPANHQASTEHREFLVEFSCEGNVSRMHNTY